MVPNLYQVLGGAEGGGVERPPDSGFTSPADPLRAPTRVGEPDLFAAAPALGAHEVIINAPRHVSALSELGPDELGAALEAWRERIRAHAADAAYCHLIVNEGPAAGASLDHTHAQLYALEFVPTAVARERERFTAYHERTAGGHLLEDVAAEEVRRSERLVAIDDEALLVAPWASRSPFELRVIPRRPAPRFEDADAGAGMIHAALSALARLFGAPPQLNLWVRTAPRGVEEFHWHIDILPRLTVRAGFEMGTGIEVNVYPPERAAEDLRGALD